MMPPVELLLIDYLLNSKGGMMLSSQLVTMLLKDSWAYSLPLDSDVERGIKTPPSICLFHPKAIENVKNSHLLIPLS